jgi:vacuolar protein sorting-associated protein 45
MGIVSLVFSQTEILQKEVYLFERLDTPAREKMPHVNAVVFVRPTDDNFELLKHELHEAKYGQYYLFFSNVTKSSLLEDLAANDEHDAVQQVHEFFADVYAVSKHAFTLNLPRIFLSPRDKAWPAHKRRVLDGLSALLLAVRRRPTIRHAAQSELAEQLAVDLARRYDEHRDLFEFRAQPNAPILLLLDRKDDPVTPLLQQWTYQAMVHELLGLENNKVATAQFHAKQEQPFLVLSAEQDSFYAENQFVNFGDLGVNIKALVEKYADKSKANQNIQSIDDIKRFIETLPEFQKTAGNTSKHVAIVSELSRVVESRQLFAVSELEQELATKNDHGVARDNALDLLAKPTIGVDDKVRLAALYALRYEDASGNITPKLVEALAQAGADRDQVRVIANALEYAGSHRRTGDLFGDKTFMSLAKKNFKRGLSGATNVYTEHQPLLTDTLDQLVKGKLRPDLYPFAYGQQPQPKDKVLEIIVFQIGGITFEEVLAVERFREANPTVSVVIGGSHIHNSHSFVHQLDEAKKAMSQ